MSLQLQLSLKDLRCMRHKDLICATRTTTNGIFLAQMKQSEAYDATYLAVHAQKQYMAMC
jgi:hypothetical protein